MRCRTDSRWFGRGRVGRDCRKPERRAGFPADCGRPRTSAVRSPETTPPAVTSAGTIGPRPPCAANHRRRGRIADQGSKDSDENPAEIDQCADAVFEAQATGGEGGTRVRRALFVDRTGTRCSDRNDSSPGGLRYPRWARRPTGPVNGSVARAHSSSPPACLRKGVRTRQLGNPGFPRLPIRRAGGIFDDHGRSDKRLDRQRQGDDGKPHRFKRAGADR